MSQVATSNPLPDFARLRNSPVYDVRSWAYLVSDSDWQPAIQAAHDRAVSDGGGGIVLLPAGEIGVGDHILFDSGVTFQGRGVGVTTIKLLDNATTDVFRANTTRPTEAEWAAGTITWVENTHFRDFSIDGNYLNQGLSFGVAEGRDSYPTYDSAWLAGIRLLVCRYCSIESVQVNNPGGYGAEVKYSTDCLIQDFHAVGPGVDDGLNISDSWQSDAYSATRRIRVIGGSATGFGQIEHEPATKSGLEIDDGPREIYVWGFRSWNNNRGFDLHNHVGAPIAGDVELENCEAWDNNNKYAGSTDDSFNFAFNGWTGMLKMGKCTSNGGTDYDDVRLTASSAENASLEIDGLEIRGCSRHGLALTGGAMDRAVLRKVDVQDFSGEGSNRVGINVSNTSAIAWLSIEGAVVKGASPHGIQIIGDVTRGRIRQSTSNENDQQGYRITPSNCEEFRVMDCDAEDNGTHGLLLFGGIAWASVIGGSMRNNTTHGLWLATSGGGTHATVVGLTAEGNGTSGITSDWNASGGRLAITGCLMPGEALVLNSLTNVSATITGNIFGSVSGEGDLANDPDALANNVIG